MIINGKRPASSFLSSKHEALLGIVKAARGDMPGAGRGVRRGLDPKKLIYVFNYMLLYKKAPHCMRGAPERCFIRSVIKYVPIV
jgi:hypothetical protein